MSSRSQPGALAAAEERCRATRLIRIVQLRGSSETIGREKTIKGVER